MAIFSFMQEWHHRPQRHINKSEGTDPSSDQNTKVLKEAGEPDSGVLQYERLGKQLTEDRRYIDYATHPLMRIIAVTTRSWCDQQLMKDLQTGTPESENLKEKSPYEELRSRNDLRNGFDDFSRFYGIGHAPLMPPRQSLVFDKKLFRKFPKEEYDRLLVEDNFSPSLLTDSTVELGVDAVKCAPWSYDSFFDRMELNDQTRMGEEWYPHRNSQFVMTLPFCMTAVYSAGFHATAAGILLHTGKPELNAIRNYTLSPMFDRVNTDGGTWQLDGEPYCYVSDPLAAKIWELCRAVHKSPYPIRYRGVVVNSDSTDDSMGKA